MRSVSKLYKKKYIFFNKKNSLILSIEWKNIFSLFPKFFKKRSMMGQISNFLDGFSRAEFSNNFQNFFRQTCFGYQINFPKSPEVLERPSFGYFFCASGNMFKKSNRCFRQILEFFWPENCVFSARTLPSKLVNILKLHKKNLNN